MASPEAAAAAPPTPPQQSPPSDEGFQMSTIAHRNHTSRATSSSSNAEAPRPLELDDEEEEVAPMPPGLTNQTLGVWALAALTFFGVSGGPYGIEELVAAGGPLLTIVIICLVPWVWCIPVALITAELATTWPDMGGYIVWVDRAFGRFWAFQNGCVKVCGNMFDNALYPLLFLFYLENLTGDLTFWTRLVIQESLIAVCVVLNVLGVDVVSDAAFLLMIVIILPFLLLVAVGLLRGGVNPADWAEPRQFGLPVELTSFITIALWKTSGYDNVGTCAAEVKDPRNAFPRAMILSVGMVTLVYLLPILVGVSYAKEYAKWVDGYFVQVARLVCGGEDWLAVWVTITGSITSLAMLNTTICTNARAIQSMGALGFFPAALGEISPRFRTPAKAVCLNGLVVGLIAPMMTDFLQVANLSMFFYAWTILLLVAAFWRLRGKFPEQPRPYRLPVQHPGLLLLLVVAPPSACCLLLIFTSSPKTWAMGLVFMLCTLVLWFPLKRLRVMREAKRQQMLLNEQNIAEAERPLPAARAVEAVSTV